MVPEDQVQCAGGGSVAHSVAEKLLGRPPGDANGLRLSLVRGSRVQLRPDRHVSEADKTSDKTGYTRSHAHKDSSVARICQLIRVITAILASNSIHCSDSLATNCERLGVVIPNVVLVNWNVKGTGWLKV